MIKPKIENEGVVSVPLRILESMAVAMQDASERLDFKGTRALTEHLYYLNDCHGAIPILEEAM